MPSRNNPPFGQLYLSLISPILRINFCALCVIRESLFFLADFADFTDLFLRYLRYLREYFFFSLISPIPRIYFCALCVICESIFFSRRFRRLRGLFSALSVLSARVFFSLQGEGSGGGRLLITLLISMDNLFTMVDNLVDKCLFCPFRRVMHKEC